MGYILHMSDFHLGKNPDLEHSRLMELADWLEKSNILLNYLVFTGDMIDAKKVSIKCIREIVHAHPKEYEKLDLSKIEEKVIYDKFIARIKEFDSHIREYDDHLKEQSSQCMDKAQRLFMAFVDKLGLSSERVIICCGNHDRVRYLSADFPSFSCSDRRIDEDLLSNDYFTFNQLCKCVNKKITYNTSVYTHEGLNFIIANSNWRAPENDETNKMCIHCSKVANILTDISSAPGFNRNNNIFIAHKPFDDFCETAKFPYGSGEQLTVREMIERTSAVFLYGDKHSYEVKLNNHLKEFMCGLPLSSTGVRYNLINYSPNKGFVSCKYVLHSSTGWKLIPVTDCIGKVYDTSKEYQKGYAFKLLTGKSDIPTNWDQAINIVQTTVKNGVLKNASKLFSSCSTIDKGRDKIAIEENDFFEQFYKLIENSTTHKPINVKGDPGTGKSTFMTMEYLYMLWRFCSGTSRYIPFYFSVDYKQSRNEVLSDIQEDNIEKIIQKEFSLFKQFLQLCVSIGADHQLPICVFIDGLDKKNMLIYSGKTLEAQIYEELESTFKKQDGKYIMSFNTHYAPFFDNTFDQMNRFDYVLFINSVSIVSYKKKTERHENLLSSFLQLKGHGGHSEKEEFRNKLLKIHRITVDLDFLHKILPLMQDTKKDDDAWGVMKRYVELLSEAAEDLFGAPNIEKIQYAAFLLFFKGKTYQEITETISISINDFVQIRDNPSIYEYLIACYFVHELKNSSKANGRISQDSILNCFITRDMSIMIRLVMEETTTSQRVLRNFISKHAEELEGYLYSNIVYLAGHNKTGNSTELVESIRVTKTCESSFFNYCQRRSYDLAKIVSENSKILAEDFIYSLMDNEEYRNFNRAYQLHYYQDIPDTLGDSWAEWNVAKSHSSGFDFHNCFLVLVSKLELGFSSIAPYPLMEIDLFTICDLIYSRLQKAGMNRALFYSADYNKENDSLCKDILEKTTSLLAEYIKRCTISNSRIYAYFSFMKNKLEQVVKEINKNTGKNTEIPYVSQSYDFKSILMLETMPRVGWNINHIGPIKIEDQPKYASVSSTDLEKEYSQVKETIMQHVFETVYIAHLFLPETLDNASYSKSKVISLLLFSELGKTSVGDYSPEYTNAKKSFLPKERTKLMEFLVLGANDGYANHGSLFDSLITTENEHTDINMIICQEIKRIQMEYKYYSLYDQLNFDEKRHKEFQDEFHDPSTAVCRKIRKKLITENPDFQKIFCSKK